MAHHLKAVIFVALATLALAAAAPSGWGGAESYSSLSLGKSEPVTLILGPAPESSWKKESSWSQEGSWNKEAAWVSKEPEIIAYPKYLYKYGVEDRKTGDIKDQAEERDGDVVKGEYSLLQPDGRKRVVKYECDKKSGCNALVSYSGHAIHPEVVKLVKSDWN